MSVAIINYGSGNTFSVSNALNKIQIKNEIITNPSAKDILQLGDTLVITGTHKAVDLAFDLLSGNSNQTN